MRQETFRMTREYLNARVDPLGKSREETTIRFEMQQAMVQLILERLQALT